MGRFSPTAASLLMCIPLESVLRVLRVLLCMLPGRSTLVTANTLGEASGVVLPVKKNRNIANKKQTKRQSTLVNANTLGDATGIVLPVNKNVKKNVAIT